MEFVESTCALSVDYTCSIEGNMFSVLPMHVAGQHEVISVFGPQFNH
jgi:hypothetical protein